MCRFTDGSCHDCFRVARGTNRNKLKGVVYVRVLFGERARKKCWPKRLGAMTLIPCGVTSLSARTQALRTHTSFIEKYQQRQAVCTGAHAGSAHLGPCERFMRHNLSSSQDLASLGSLPIRHKKFITFLEFLEAPNWNPFETVLLC